MDDRPFVRIVVLNFNGAHFLDGCLRSLERLDYPRDRYEVIVVDNRSTDGSAELVEKRFPAARVVRNERNLGFAGGNNVAMSGSRADYVVLLNNDTEVEAGWLTALIETAEADLAVGACTSKLLFQHNRLRILMRASGFQPADSGSPDTRELGVQVFEGVTLQGGDSQACEHLEGFHGWETSPHGPFRWSKPSATLGLRLRPGGGPATLRLVLAAPRPAGESILVSLSVERWRDADPVRAPQEVCPGRANPAVGPGADRARTSLESLGTWEIGPESTVLEIALPNPLVQAATPVIQNAGTLILADGSGRDRGAQVCGTEVLQEDDLGQYDRVEEVFAGCGAAMLLRTEMLRDVGIFDEDFFMYYEDMDLSWRMRRRGWKVLYVPGAVVHHLHCGSSKEWSPLFLFHVERNRLLMLAKHAPPGLLARAVAKYAAWVAANLGRSVRSVLTKSADRAIITTRTAIGLRVLASLARLAPRTMMNRRLLAQREVVPSAKLLAWMVAG